MSQLSHLILIAALAGLFAVPVIKPVNIGLLALVFAYVLGSVIVGLPAREIADGFPAELFITMVGVTFLFRIAQQNGAVSRLLHFAESRVRPAAMPWALFVIASAMTAFGALAPAVVAMLLPIAMQWARVNGRSPILLALLVIHGAQAGGFSPLAIYGSITREIVVANGLAWDAMLPFIASAGANLIAASCAWAIFRGPENSRSEAADVAQSKEQEWRSADITLAALGGLALLTVAFRVDVGFAALAVGLVLSLASADSHRESLRDLPWTEILLITGVSTYVAILQASGTIDYVGGSVAASGDIWMAVLLVLLIAAIVSAFASSTAVLGSLVPLALPLMSTQPSIVAVGLVAAVGVAATVVDVSPFSTAGALAVANSAEAERSSTLRKLTLYAAGITCAAPAVLWLLLLPILR